MQIYIPLTDIAKYKNLNNAFIVIANWMRNHSAISCIGLWEQILDSKIRELHATLLPDLWKWFIMQGIAEIIETAGVL